MSYKAGAAYLFGDDFVGTYIDYLINGQRSGQAFFNALVKHYPEYAEKLRGSIADPFYKENGREAIDAAIEYLTKS